MAEFYHMSTYGRSPKRRAEPHEHITGIAEEAARLPHACPHVVSPRPPKLLHGVCPTIAAEAAVAQAEQAKDAVGRRLRCDGAAILASVVSYETPRAAVEKSDEETGRYRAWRHAALGWLKAEYGDALVSVVEHSDEKHLHLHAFAIPPIGADGRLQWGAIHPGRRAVDDAKRQGATGRALQSAYVEAMSRMQDGFHAAVSASFGHARLGAGRRRLSRSEVLRVRREKEAEAKQLAQEEEAEAQRLERKAQQMKQERDRIAADARAEIRGRYAAAARAASERIQALDLALKRERALVDQQADEIARLTAILSEHGLDGNCSIPGAGY